MGNSYKESAAPWARVYRGRSRVSTLTSAPAPEPREPAEAAPRYPDPRGDQATREEGTLRRKSECDRFEHDGVGLSRDACRQVNYTNCGRLHLALLPAERKS
jgi:hypothetical protein